MVDRTVTVQLRISEGQYMAALQKAGRETEQLGEKVKRMSADTERAYNTLGTSAVAFGAAGAFALKQISDEAIGFESSFAGVVKTVNGTSRELDVLGQSLRSMAKNDVPVSVNALADIAASAGQLGIQTQSIEGFTKVIADLGVATNLAGEQGATELAQFANITQMAQGDFDRLGSTIVDLGNNLATTEADITSMALRLASAGSQAGLTEADILALAGAARSVGIEAEAGGTAFSRILIEMRNAAMDGGAALDVFAETAGMSADAFAQAFQEDAASALVTFTEGLGRMEEQGLNSNAVLEELGLADIRVGNALRAAAGAGDLFREALVLGTAAWEDNTALTREAELRYATTESQIQFAKNAMVDLGIEMGENLLPLIVAVASGVGELAGFFGDLPEPVQTTAVAFLAIGSALGIVGGAALLAIPRIAATKVALADLGVTAAGTRAALLSLNTVPILAAVAAVGALTVNLGQARAEASELADEIARAAGDDPVDQLAAYNDELERQLGLRGNAGNRLVDAFFHPFQTQDEITGVEEMTARIGELEAAMRDLALEDEAARLHNLSQATDGWTQRLIAANDALGGTTSGMADWRQEVAGAGIDTEAFGQGVQSTMRQTREEIDNILGSFQGGADNFGGYQQALADLNAAHREAAQEADRAYTDITASADLYVQNLHDQVAAQQQWGTLIAEAQARGLDNIAAEIMAAGPEHNELYTDLLIDGPVERAAEAESALEEQVRQTIANMALTVDREGPDFIDGWGRIGGNAVEAIAEELGLTEDEVASVLEDSEAVARERGALIEETFGHLGTNAVDAISTSLAAGTVRIGSIVRDYAAAIATGVNPVIQQLNGTPVVVTPGSFVPGAQGGLKLAGGGQVPGGYGTHDDVPAMLTRGEHVQPVHRVREPGALQFLETMRTAGYEAALHEQMYAHYNAGGFVSPDDIPATPSFAGYGAPLVTPARLAVDLIRDKAVKLFEDLAASGGLPVGAGPIAELLWRVAGHHNHMHLASPDNSWLIGVGRKLQNMGARVAEHPAFGGVRARHAPNSWHYRGRAIDANYGPGGENATEKAFFDRVVPQIRAGTFDNGGLLPPGVTLFNNGTGMPEAAVPLDRPLEVMIVGFAPGATRDIVGSDAPTPPGVDGGYIRGLPGHLMEQIAANTEMLRIEALPAAERLVEVQDELVRLEAAGLKNTDAYVALLREAEALQGDIAREARAAAQEIERQAQAQRDAADAAQRHADQFGADLNRLLDQRDRLLAQRDAAIAKHAQDEAAALRRAADDITRLVDARANTLSGAFGALGQRFEAGWGNTVGALTREQDRRFEMFNEWADALQDLRDRGLSEDVIAAFGLDDPANIAQLRLFARATDEELTRLTASLTRNRDQAAATAAEESDLLLGALGEAIIDVRETLADTLAGLRADLTDTLIVLGQEMAQIGTDSGRSYAEMMAEALASGLPAVIALAEQYEQALRDAEAAAAAINNLEGLGSGLGTPGRSGPPIGWGTYDSGGILPPGLTLANNQTGGNEYILTPEQMRSMRAAPSGGPSFPSTLIVEIGGEQFEAKVKGVADRAHRERAYTRQAEVVR